MPTGQTLVLTYTVQATDSSGAANNTDTQTVTITITGTNDGLTLVNDTKTMGEDATAPDTSGNVLSNDSLNPQYGQTMSVTGFFMRRLASSTRTKKVRMPPVSAVWPRLPSAAATLISSPWLPTF